MTLVLVFLGTSAAVPTRARGLPSLALLTGRDILVFDAGEGTQHRMVLSRISPLRVSAVFITHLHGDHFFGLPGLIQSMAMYGRKKGLRIYGPPGLAEFLEASINASGFSPPFPLRVVEGLRLKHRSAYYTVSSFPVCHTGRPALGYLYEESEKPGKLDMDKVRRLGLEPGPHLKVLKEGRPIQVRGRVVEPGEVLGPPRRGARVVYTGDTRPCSSVVEAAREADLLVHDATFTSELREEAWEEGHSTAEDAARIAKASAARMLILTHISARYRDPSPLLREAQQIFPFTLVAEDFLRIALRSPW